MQNWAKLLDSAKGNPALAGAREALVASARKAAAEEIVRRAQTLAEVGTHRTWLDGRSKILEDEIRQTFALAMSDLMACDTLNDELPLLAAAYRLTGDESLKVRVLAQLEEIASWSPLQRPGWTCFLPGVRLPPDGKDGSWLATGVGTRVICDTLEILPLQDVPGELRSRLQSLLRAEIAQVVEDWQAKRQWFVRSNNTITNQWALPNEGLILACLAAGKDRFPREYELGAANMLAAMDSRGEKGEFEEGLAYSHATVTSMFSAARAAALAGDSRLANHPFLERYPSWVVQHLQPGRKVINAFDCFVNSAPRDKADAMSLLTWCGAYTGSAEAMWAMDHLFDGPPPTLLGLACRAMSAAEAEPPLFAAYARAPRVNWRSSWADDATGVWIRGGHETDQHDHRDRGHVNFIARGKPILIEAGTPAYHNPRIHSHYANGMGHNVLQLGMAPPIEGVSLKMAMPPGWQKLKGVAPIEVRRLDASGGEIVVDGSRCYDGLEHWWRTVEWTSVSLIVTDDVALAAGKADTILFRWHLGTEQEATISGSGGRWKVSWPDAKIEIESSTALNVTQEQLPDNTLLTREWDDCATDHMHACVVVRTAEPAVAARIVTRVVPAR